MDRWNAPQWVDFNASPMSDIDDYFNSEHKELEPKYSNGTPYQSFTDSSSPKANVSNSSYGTPRSRGFASPAVTRASRGSLASTVGGLRIKLAKKTLTKQSTTQSAVGVKESPINALTLPVNDNTNFMTKEKETEIPPREKLQEGTILGDNAEEENDNGNTMLVAFIKDKDRSTHESIVKIDTAETEKPMELENNAEKLEIKPNDARSNLSNLESRLDPSEKTILEEKNKKGKPTKPTVLTTTVRRYSISKYRRRSGKYVSMAEAVARFQYGTPERFRSANHKDYKAGPLQKSKQATMKLTYAKSPVLRCKLRTRAVVVPNQESTTHAKAISNKFTTNPPLTKIEKKSKTFPSSFPSTQGKSGNIAKPLRKIEKIPPVSLEQKTSMHPPKAPSLLKKVEKTLGESIFLKDTSAMSRSMMSESVRTHTPCKKTVPTVVSTDEGVSIKDVEILHFGIPVGNDYKKITRPMPFSFDTRNKESQREREKLKNQRIEEEKSKKSLFHARPTPSFDPAKTTTSVLRPKVNNANQENPVVRTMTFQERNELVMKKKKELMDRIVEQEKQARIFHAKPAPTFKPVFVRGNSTENLRAGDGNKRRTRGVSPMARQKGTNQESVACDNQENKAPNVASQKCPKLKNPLITQNLKLKKTK